MTRPRLRSLFSGPLLVGQGMAFLGLGSYVFLVVSGRSLTLAEFGRLSVLWSLLFGLVGGLAFPFEQEAVRSMAANGRTRDMGRVALLAGVVVILGEAFAVAWGSLRSGFAGDNALLAAMALGVLAMPLAGIVRGMLVGSGKFLFAGIELATEGLLRAGLVLILAGFAVGAGAYGWLLAGAPLIAALLVAPTAFRGSRGTAEPRAWPLLLREVGTLVLGSGLALVVLNLGPLLATRSGGAEAAGRLTSIFTLVRLPVFFSGPVAAALLPRFVAAAGQGELTAAAHLLGRRLALVLLPAGLVLGLIAPTAVKLLYGHRYSSGLALSLLLAASGVVHLLAMVLQSALVGDNQRGAVVSAWAGGLIVLVVGSLLLSGASLLGIGVAYLASALITLWIMLARV